MPFIARFGLLWMFPFEHRIARCGFCWYEKSKQATKGKKIPNGNQAQFPSFSHKIKLSKIPEYPTYPRLLVNYGI